MNKRIKKKRSAIEKYRGITAKKLRSLLMNMNDMKNFLSNSNDTDDIRIIPYLLHDESNNVQFSDTNIPY